jgi:hypothetical protein
MSYTTDYNLPQMPSGPVDWPAIYNDLVSKVEVGRTIKLTAATTITRGKCFYIDTNGKAAIATSASDIMGIWQTSSTGMNADGYGQIDGTLIDTHGMPLGALLYSNASGALTTVTSTSKIAIASATSSTKIVIKRKDATASSGSGDVIGPATNTDAYLSQWDGTNSKTLKNGIPITQLLDGRDNVDSYTSSVTMDYSVSASHYLELTANTTVTVSNIPNGGRMVLVLKQGSGGSKYVTGWSGINYWQGGSTPTLTTTAAHFDVITLIKSNSLVFAAATLDFS